MESLTQGDCSIAFRAVVQKLIKFFSSVWFDHVSRVHRKHVDVLATLGSNVDVPEETVDAKVMQRTLPATFLFIHSISKFGTVSLFKT